MTDTDLRAELCDLHGLLPRHDLVAWTSGNISARVPGRGRMLIKPSGVSYDDLAAEMMVDVGLDTLDLRGSYRPSSDTATHAYIYREMPEVGGIVHTHSPYATAWSTTGRDLPCVLTAMADEFGGPIPCAGFAMIGSEDIGREVVDALTGHRSNAVLLRSHGVFTIGKTPRAALKAAVMCEDVARTIVLASSLGTPHAIAADDVDRLHRRYITDYGQTQSAEGPT